MASGISFLAGLLTGAATGVEQGKKIKLAKEENEIRRQQVQATKELGFAQIGATKAQHEASLALQEKLGLLNVGLEGQRIGLGYAGLGNQRDIAGMEAATRVYLQMAEAAAAKGNMQEAARLRELAAESEWARGEKTLDRAPGRAAAQHKAISLIDEDSHKRVMDYKAKLDKEATAEEWRLKGQEKAEDAAMKFSEAMAGIIQGTEEDNAKIRAQMLHTMVDNANGDPEIIKKNIAVVNSLIDDLGSANVATRDRVLERLRPLGDAYINNAGDAFKKQWRGIVDQMTTTPTTKASLIRQKEAAIEGVAPADVGRPGAAPGTPISAKIPTSHPVYQSARKYLQYQKMGTSDSDVQWALYNWLKQSKESTIDDAMEALLRDLTQANAPFEFNTGGAPQQGRIGMTRR